MKKVIRVVFCILSFALADRSVATPLYADQIAKYDEYGDLPIADERARLDLFACELKQSSTTVGYVIVYAGRRAYVDEAKARAIRVKNYLVWSGISPERIVWVDGGYREGVSHELFIFARGGYIPTPAPLVEPETVQIVGRGKPKNLKSLIPSKAGEAYRRKWDQRCKPPLPSG